MDILNLANARNLFQGDVAMQLVLRDEAPLWDRIGEKAVLLLIAIVPFIFLDIYQP